MSSVADHSSSLPDWNIGLSESTTGVIRARFSLYGDGILSNLVHALRELRRYISRSVSRREASPTLESVMTTVLSPILQEFYQQEGAYDVLEELLDIIGVSMSSSGPFCHFERVCAGSNSSRCDVLDCSDTWAGLS